MDLHLPPVERREFLKKLLYALPTIASHQLILPSAEAKLSPKKRLNGAILGCGYITRKLHIHSILRNPLVNLRYVCDIDKDQLELAKTILKKDSHLQGIKFISNYQELTLDKNLDFVLVALPHHWLAKAAIELIKAKKNLYLEKPCCLTLEEYLALEKTYKQSSVIVQVGTQNRSNPSHSEGIKYFKNGLIGEVTSGLCLTNQSKSDRIIPAQGKPIIPQNMDLKKWFGPTKPRSIKRKDFHEDWARFWDLSHGIGDRNVHRLDMMNWAMGFSTVSDSVRTYAGRFPSKKGDCGDTPNTSFSIHRNQGFTYTNEYKIWHAKEKLGLRRGLIFQGKKGYFAMSNISRSYHIGLNGKTLKEFGPKRIRANHNLHFDNFIDSIIKGTRENLNNDLLTFLPSAGNSILENLSVLKGKNISLSKFNSILGQSKELEIPEDYISTLVSKSSASIELKEGKLLKDINIEKMVKNAKPTDFPIRKQYPQEFQL